jgi:hypothetical protein
MNVEYTVYEKYYLTTSEWKVNHWRGWSVGTMRRCRNLIKTYFLGWCHINFIKSKTYSERLPPNSYDNPHLGNELMNVTRHFLQCTFRYYMYDIFLYHRMCIKCVYVSRVTFLKFIQIMICTSRILRQHKLTFQHIYSKLYETKAHLLL